MLLLYVLARFRQAPSGAELGRAWDIDHAVGIVHDPTTRGIVDDRSREAFVCQCQFDRRQLWLYYSSRIIFVSIVASAPTDGHWIQLLARSWEYCADLPASDDGKDTIKSVAFAIPIKDHLAQPLKGNSSDCGWHEPYLFKDIQ